MVVLQIDGGGFQTAATAYAEANQLTALAHHRLVAVLADCGGMAGDDTTSTDFATAYDTAATEAVASLADLTDAYAALGRLTHATLANHTHANTHAMRAVVAGATVYDGGPLPDTDPDSGPAGGYVTVLPGTPPTARGTTSLPALPAKVDWILDHLQGFAWPTADPGRLRTAASAWRIAAHALTDVTDCCDSADRGLWHERSPEIPTALAATSQLKWHTHQIADQLTALATACDAYADAVEAKHTEILDLAHWLLEQLVEGILISLALGALTAGTGTAAGLTAVTARVATETPRFTALLDTLRALTAGYATTIRAARDALSTTRLNLLKYKNAAVARSAAQGERGEMRLAWTQEKGWLRSHEHSGSHTLTQHVERSDSDLMARFSRERRPPFASTFKDLPEAERIIGGVLRRRRGEIEDWLAHGGRRLRLEHRGFRTTGRSMDPTGHARDVRGVRVILERDASMPDGFRILTAFPQP